MAKLFFSRGLQVAQGILSGTADGFAALQSCTLDDTVTAFVAGDTTLGSPTNVVKADFDSTPTRSGTEVTHRTTYTGASLAGITVRRIVLHNAAAASVSGSSTTVVCGIDGQSLLFADVDSVVIVFKTDASDAS